MTGLPGGSADAAVFVLAVPGIPGAGSPKTVFQELVGLASEIEVAVPATPPASGAATHSKQVIGATVPPSVTLKRGVDGDGAMWQWHQLALDGGPTALQNAVLGLYNAADYTAGKPPLAAWNLVNAWCAKIAIASAGAGGGGAAIGTAAGGVAEIVTLACDRIVPMKP